MNPVITYDSSKTRGSVHLAGDKIGRVFQSGRSKRWYFKCEGQPVSASFTHAELAAEALVVRHAWIYSAEKRTER